MRLLHNLLVVLVSDVEIAAGIHLHAAVADIHTAADGALNVASVWLQRLQNHIASVWEINIAEGIHSQGIRAVVGYKTLRVTTTPEGLLDHAVIALVGDIDVAGPVDRHVGRLTQTVITRRVRDDTRRVRAAGERLLPHLAAPLIDDIHVAGGIYRYTGCISPTAAYRGLGAWVQACERPGTGAGEVDRRSHCGRAAGNNDRAHSLSRRGRRKGIVHRAGGGGAGGEAIHAGAAAHQSEVEADGSLGDHADRADGKARVEVDSGGLHRTGRSHRFGWQKRLGSNCRREAARGCGIGVGSDCRQRNIAEIEGGDTRHGCRGPVALRVARRAGDRQRNAGRGEQNRVAIRAFNVHLHNAGISACSNRIGWVGRSSGVGQLRWHLDGRRAGHRDRKRRVLAVIRQYDGASKTAR